MLLEVVLDGEGEPEGEAEEEVVEESSPRAAPRTRPPSMSLARTMNGKARLAAGVSGKRRDEERRWTRREAIGAGSTLSVAATSTTAVTTAAATASTASIAAASAAISAAAPRLPRLGLGTCCDEPAAAEATVCSAPSAS